MRGVSEELKVAIVGFAPTTRDLAPFGDPSFQIWGLNHLWPEIPRWDVWFDMHAPAWSKAHLAHWAEHEAWLKQDHQKPLYMLDKYPEYPSSIRFPIEAVTERFGSYFTCGPAYMIALAIFVGAVEIQVWGMDMRHDTEYSAQRPCTEWWLGIARGLGIRVVVPEQSALLGQGQPLYGYEEAAGAWAELQRALLARRKEAAAERQKFLEAQEQAMAQVHAFDGAIAEIDEWMKRTRQRARGGVL